MELNFFEFKPSTFSKMEVNGNVHFEDQLIIEGDFKGNITGKENAILIIALGSRVEGTIVCKEVHVSGHFKGSLKAERLIIEASGFCQGEIVAQELRIEDEAKVECKITTAWDIFSKEASESL